MTDGFFKTLYNLLLPGAAGAGYAASLFHEKLREAASGRKGWKRRWTKAGAGFENRPVWFHVSSVGEFEQARPVITSLARTHPEIPVVVSFSSPSGYHFARRKETLGPDNTIRFIDYLPIDFRRNAETCLSAVDPRLMVFVKFDLWPNLIWEAKRREVPVVLIDATLSPSSHRTSGAGRAFYNTVYSNIDKILAISDADAGRFRDTVPRHPAIGVTGDTRFDRVMERKQSGRGVGFNLAGEGRKVVICGSTWPRDESRLLPALKDVLAGQDDVYAIIAPHEPLADCVESLLAWARSSGFTAAAASDGMGTPLPRVVVVDTVGILAETYRMGDIAYIGGGFSTGVHSVIEPAIEGLPVLFGPVHDNSFEALRLLDAGAGFEVNTPDDFRRVLGRLLSDDQVRCDAGAAAVVYVESQLGATEKCVAAIAEYL